MIITRPPALNSVSNMSRKSCSANYVSKMFRNSCYAKPVSLDETRALEVNLARRLVHAARFFKTQTSKTLQRLNSIQKSFQIQNKIIDANIIFQCTLGTLTSALVHSVNTLCYTLLEYHIILTSVHSVRFIAYLTKCEH